MQAKWKYLKNIIGETLGKFFKAFEHILLKPTRKQEGKLRNYIAESLPNCIQKRLKLKGHFLSIAETPPYIWISGDRAGVD